MEAWCRPGSALESLPRPGPVAASIVPQLLRRHQLQPPCPGIDAARGRAPRNARGLDVDQCARLAKGDPNRFGSVSSPPPCRGPRHPQTDDSYESYNTGQPTRQWVSSGLCEGKAIQSGLICKARFCRPMRRLRRSGSGPGPRTTARPIGRSTRRSSSTPGR